MGKVRLLVSMVAKRKEWFPYKWYDRDILMFLR